MIPVHDLENKHEHNIRIVKLGARTGYDVTRPHRHNYFELFVFGKGEGVHYIDFVPFEIGSSEVHIVSSGRVHRVDRAPDTNGYVILFESSVFNSNTLLSDFLFEHTCYDVGEMCPIYQFNEEVKQQIMNLADSVWEDYNSNNRLKVEYILSNLNLILINCMRTVDRKGWIMDKNQEIYIQFRKLLKDDFRNLKKVKDYASSLNISEKQLNFIVKEKTGFSTSAMIYKQIILEAKRLLNTGLSSKEVAYDLNFEDPAHFSKFFKRKTGISPGTFQKIQF